MLCPACGEDNQDGANYCVSCGSTLLQEGRKSGKNHTDSAGMVKYCTRCGSRMGAIDLRCPACGSEQIFVPSTLKEDRAFLYRAVSLSSFGYYLSRASVAMLVFYVPLLFFSLSVMFALIPGALYSVSYSSLEIGLMDLVFFVAGISGLYAYNIYLKAARDLENLIRTDRKRRIKSLSESYLKNNFLPGLTVLGSVAYLLTGILIVIYTSASVVTLNGLTSGVSGLMNSVMMELTSAFLIIGNFFLGMRMRRAGDAAEFTGLKRGGTLLSIPVVSMVAPMVIYLTVRRALRENAWLNGMEKLLEDFPTNALIHSTQDRNVDSSPQSSFPELRKKILSAFLDNDEMAPEHPD